jgi:hypothetical protein
MLCGQESWSAAFVIHAQPTQAGTGAERITYLAEVAATWLRSSEASPASFASAYFL